MCVPPSSTRGHVPSALALSAATFAASSYVAPPIMNTMTVCSLQARAPASSKRHYKIRMHAQKAQNS
jgi:hypothetical protein